ncbi:MAG: hypothetical protein KBB51_04015 [Candidatus Moranbacteria bacterium]|nr:hypothetical protein [Candidatus Moranbacteria bacterium]
MSKAPQTFLIGSVVAIGNPTNSDEHLGIVVNMKKGSRWFANDPVSDFTPTGHDLSKFILVRWLIPTVAQYALRKTPSPQAEPEPIDTVRWSYVERTLVTRIMCPPEASAIKSFQGCMRFCALYVSSEQLDLMASNLSYLAHFASRKKPSRGKKVERSPFDIYMTMLSDVLVGFGDPA